MLCMTCRGVMSPLQMYWVCFVPYSCSHDVGTARASGSTINLTNIKNFVIYLHILLRKIKWEILFSNFIFIFTKVCMFCKLKTDKTFNFLCQQIGIDIQTIQRVFRFFSSQFIYIIIYLFMLILVGIVIAWINIVQEAGNSWNIFEIRHELKLHHF